MTLDDEAELFDQAPVGYILIDGGTGRILRANYAFLTLTGRSHDDVLGATMNSMLTVAGRIYDATHLRPMLDLTGHVEEVALEVVTADGERVPVLLSANVTRVEGREVTRAVFFEAKERRRYETELLRATREAEAARERALDLSKTLQQTLIPPVPPSIPRLGIAAVYRPAGAGDEVGGDFYDVFQVGDHEWVVVIGDVSGKGIPAATVTAYVRFRVRGLAMQVPDPADLLRQLDQDLRDYDTDHFCTVVVLKLCDDGGVWRLSGAAGGHPLPLLGRRDGTVTELGVPGSILGLLESPVYTTFEHALDDDEFVVLYTDGISEARHGHTMFGTDTLMALVAGHADVPRAITEIVLHEALAYQDGDAADDIAVLTLYPTP